ncbi:MAG: hypothetical protein F4227_01070 [Gammaproteobacteria bacterium]|nr:hypothetical protein [Gammaproteobacteria bacterium]MYF01600.1 hypothetical protein [Gammaproteobacteria bacterium]MYI76462.1 hypothetical protein [Gammaproteobacteria bacterium]
MTIPEYLELIEANIHTDKPKTDQLNRKNRPVTLMRHFLRTNLWSIISGLVAAYFLWVFHLQTGFPPTASLTTTSATYLALFVFFLVAPFVQKLRLGKIIEFEARVEEARAEIKDVRTEFRASMDEKRFRN